MSRIKTDDLLDRIAAGNFKTVELRGIRNGSFVTMLETDDGTFIHEGSKGEMKEYPKADFALKGLARKTNLNEIIIDIGLWNPDA